MQLVGHNNKEENLVYVFTTAGQASRFDETKCYSARVIKNDFCQKRNNQK